MPFFILKCGRLNLLNFDHFHEHNIKSVFKNTHRSAALRTSLFACSICFECQDSITCDFYLWWYLKPNVYKRKATNIRITKIYNSKPYWTIQRISVLRTADEHVQEQVWKGVFVKKVKIKRFDFQHLIIKNGVHLS